MSNPENDVDRSLARVALVVVILQGFILIPVILFLLTPLILLRGLIELGCLNQTAGLGLILITAIAVLTIGSIIFSWTNVLSKYFGQRIDVDVIMLVVDLIFLLTLRFTHLKNIFWIASGSFIALINLWGTMACTVSACVLLIAVSQSLRAILSKKYLKAIRSSLSSVVLTVILLVLIASVGRSEPDFRHKAFQRHSVQGILLK